MPEKYNFDDIPMKEIKTDLKWIYNAYKTILPELNDEQIKKCIEIAVDTCGVCHNDHSGCQCWNDE